MQPRERLPVPAGDEIYHFASPYEEDATYLVIAWFAISESASLGIFPLLSALHISKENDPAYFARFFENGFQHFRDEQRHANMWCKALLEFTENHPEVVKRVELPESFLKIMLKSMGKPHSVLEFGVDCLAFEVVMQALYEVLEPRLHYPPLARILQVIIKDEVAHTEFDRGYLPELLTPLSGRLKLRMIFRYWRNLLGVLITVRPMLKALQQHKALNKAEFRTRVAFYARQNGALGSQPVIAGLIARCSLI